MPHYALDTPSQFPVITIVDQDGTRADTSNAVGFVGTNYPLIPNGAVNPIGGAANRTVYFKGRGSLRISKVGIHVGTASGNIAIAIFTSAGGRNPPTTRLATTGSVACPVAGYAELTLDTAIDFNGKVHYFAVGVDNGTVTLTSMGVNGSFANSSLGIGQSYQEVVYPPPVTANPSARIQPVTAIVGVP